MDFVYFGGSVIHFHLDFGGGKIFSTVFFNNFYKCCQILRRAIIFKIYYPYIGGGDINFPKLSGEADKNWRTNFFKSGGSVYYEGQKLGE